MHFAPDVVCGAYISPIPCDKQNTATVPSHRAAKVPRTILILILILIHILILILILILRSMQRMLKVERKRICEALYQDLRKNEFESYNMEINPVEHEIQHQLDHIATWSEPEAVKMDPLENLVISMTGHGKAALYRDPLGVCLVIGAWNYPLHLTLLPVVGAIAAGNTVLIKTPSPKYSAATAALIAELIPQYLDPSCVLVVEGIS